MISKAGCQVENVSFRLVSGGCPMKDKIWLWGHKEGIQNSRWGLLGESKITPADACKYMGIENLIFVREFGMPLPEEYEYYASSFSQLKRVGWSLVGAGNTFENGELERIIKLKNRYSNIVDVIMDDFFVSEKPVFSPEEISLIRRRLHKEGLKLWVVIYEHQLNLNIEKYLEEVDIITYWTWKSEELQNLEKDFKRFVNLTPGKIRMFGCYMWDYGNNKPMPLNLMEKQCSLGLEWIKEGLVEGMIFLPSCICDLGLETVEWAKKWIEVIDLPPQICTT